MSKWFNDSVSHIRERLQTRTYYITFCLGCFLIALQFGLFSTQSGPGLTEDSMSYILIGESVYEGNGFPYASPWPPLYPLSIAGLMHLGFDGEQAARLVPIFSFAALMFPMFFLSRIISGVLVGYATCLTTLVFTPLLLLSTIAWTEMILILFSSLAILFLVKFGQSNTTGIRTLCLAAIFTCIAILTRYIGVVLLPIGLMVIIVKNRPHWRIAVYHAVLYISISCLLIVPWLYRNVAVTSHLTGQARPDSTVGPLTNILSTFVTFLVDFLLFTPAILAVYFIVRAARGRTPSVDKRALFGYIKKNYIVVSYIIVYLSTLIIMRSMWEFDSINTRLVSPVYPFVILTAFSLLYYYFKKIKTRRLPRHFFKKIAVIGLLLITFQGGLSLLLYLDAKDGVGYNSSSWRSSQGLSWLQNNLPENATLYSNNSYVVRFRLRKPTIPLYKYKNEEQIDDFVSKLNNEENAFIICFKGTNRGSESMMSNCLSALEFTELARELNTVTQVADFLGSTIWCVEEQQIETSTLR